MASFAVVTPQCSNKNYKKSKFAGILRYINEMVLDNDSNLPKRDFMDVLETTVDTCTVLMDSGKLGDEDKKSCEAIIQKLKEIRKEFFLLDECGQPIKAEDPEKGEDGIIPIVTLDQEEIAKFRQQQDANPFARKSGDQEIAELKSQLLECNRKLAQIERVGGQRRTKHRKRKLNKKSRKSRRRKSQRT
jgi:hypothetical protein